MNPSRGRGAGAGRGGRTEASLFTHNQQVGKEREMWSAVALQAHLSATLLRGIVPNIERVEKQATGAAANIKPKTTATNYGPSTSSSSSAVDEPKGIKTIREVYGEDTQLATDAILVKDLTTVPMPRPTLAQRMGIVALPPPLPTTSEWRSLEHAAVLRDDALHPCPICHEPFRLSDTLPPSASGVQNRYGHHDPTSSSHLTPSPSQGAMVILSCSHVFHERCLLQLEKFARMESLERQCPVCRCAQYRKKRHVRGTAQLQQVSIVLIQSLIRGYLQRKRYVRLRMKKDPMFREETFFQVVRSLSDALMAISVQQEDDMLMAIRQAEEAQMAVKVAMMGAKEWQEILHRCWQRLGCGHHGGGALVGTHHIPPTTNPTQGDDDDDDEGETCGICLQSLTTRLPGTGRVVTLKPCIVTSCQHIFHAACMESLEKFAASEQLQPTAMASNAVVAHGATAAGANSVASSRPSSLPVAGRRAVGQVRAAANVPASLHPSQGRTAVSTRPSGAASAPTGSQVGASTKLLEPVARGSKPPARPQQQQQSGKSNGSVWTMSPAQLAGPPPVQTRMERIEADIAATNAAMGAGGHTHGARRRPFYHCPMCRSLYVSKPLGESGSDSEPP